MRPALLFVLLLAACDPVVEQRQIGPAEMRTYDDVEYGFGYCMTCMPGFDGKLECGAKLSHYCPIYVTRVGPFAPFEQRHESGRLDTTWVRQ